jgi:hypothetical protein
VAIVNSSQELATAAPVLIALVMFVLSITAAVGGFGYRGLYFAIAVACFGFGSIAVSLTTSERQVANMDFVQRRGAEAINAVAPPAAAVLFATAFGCLIGGFAFRPKRNTPPRFAPETAEALAAIYKPQLVDMTTPISATRKDRIENRRSIDLGDGVGFELGIVGESNYMAPLRAIAKRRTSPGAQVEFTATLQLEPENQFDANAVVVLDDAGQKIGYLSRGDAVDYGPALKALAAKGHRATCRAKLVGGTQGKKNFGVWLDIDDPDELRERLTNEQPF